MEMMRASHPTPARKCRACLDLIDSADCVDLEVPLFDCSAHSMFDTFLGSSARTITVLEVFNECTQLHVRLTDLEMCEPGLEACRCLCIACSFELQRAYQFIVKARLSHATLREQMVKCEVEKKAEDELELIETLDEDFEQELSESCLKSRHTNDPSRIGDDVEQTLAEIFGLDCHEEQRRALTLKKSEIEEKSEADLVRNAKPENGEKEQRNPQDFPSTNFLDQSLVTHNDSEASGASDTENTTSIEVRLILPTEQNKEDEQQHLLEFKCELCVAKFEFQRDLVLHYANTHDESDLHFPCNRCDRRFFTKSSLNMHIRQIHQNCEYLDCPQCGRTVLKSFFKTHLRRHKKKKRFLCSECPNTFTSNYTLQKHMRIHSKDRDRNIECELCERRFYTVEAFRTHLITHKDPLERETYSCSLCRKVFMRQANLKLHMQMHRGETTDCPHCGKQFVRRKDLEIHIRFHTGEFPYSCKVCSKRFAIKGHLTAHEKKHEGIKYQCSACSKMFLNVAGLRQHSYEHTGMPFYCGVCKKGFPTKFKVRRHIRSVHHSLLNAGSKDEDVEEHIKRFNADKNPFAVLETKHPVDTNENYTVEMLDEDAHDLVDYIIEEI